MIYILLPSKLMQLSDTVSAPDVNVIIFRDEMRISLWGCILRVGKMEIILWPHLCDRALMASSLDTVFYCIFCRIRIFWFIKVWPETLLLLFIGCNKLQLSQHIVSAILYMVIYLINIVYGKTRKKNKGIV